MYGDSSTDPSGYEELAVGGMVVAYRVKKAVVEWVNQELPVHQPSHIYSGMLNDLLGRTLPGENFVAIRFYTKHIVAAVVKGQQLQLIQSLNYDTAEDILYYLLSLVQQFNLDPGVSHVEVSGELDKRSATAQQLPNLFGKVTWHESGDTGIFSKVLADHPVHYFTLIINWEYEDHFGKLGRAADRASCQYAPYPPNHRYRERGPFQYPPEPHEL